MTAWMVPRRPAGAGAAQIGIPSNLIVVAAEKGRTLSFVVRQEADGVALVRGKVAADAKLHADEPAIGTACMRSLRPTASTTASPTASTASTNQAET